MKGFLEEVVLNLEEYVNVKQRNEKRTSKAEVYHKQQHEGKTQAWGMQGPTGGTGVL